MKRGEDLGSNYYTGPYKTSELAKVFDRAKTLLETEISNYAYYQATNEPAAFVAAPIFNEGVVVGVVAIQLSNQDVYQVINNYTGLGQTGEVLVVSKTGNEVVFVSPIRHDPYAAFRRKILLGGVELPFLQQAVQGSQGNAVVQDYRGQETVAAWRYLPSLRWGLVVKIDTAEAFVPIQTQIWAMFLLAIVIAGVVTVIAIYVARWLSRPIIELKTVAERIATGDLNAQALARSDDELGALAHSFNAMTSRLRDNIRTLDARATELQTVAEVSSTASTEIETEKLLWTVSNLTKERFGLYHSHIYLLNEAGDTLVLAAGAGEPGRQMVAEGRAIPVSREQSLVARAARERQGVIVNDVRAAPDFLPNPLLPNTRSELAVPMLVGDRLIGVFDIQSNIVNRFTEENANIQTTLAAQIAVAIQNNRQFEQTQKFALELKGWQDAVNAAAIVSSSNVKGEIDYANDNFVKISQYSREELLGSDHRIVNSGYMSKEEIRNLWVTIANGGTWRGEFRNKAKNGSIYWVDSIISPILNAQGKPVRYLGIRFDITQRKQVELAVAKRATELQLASQVSTAAATITETDKLLQAVVDQTKQAFGLYHAHIYLMNDAGDTLELASGAGDIGAQMVAQGRAIPLNREQSLVARAARERQGVIVNDVRAAPDFLPNLLLPDTRSELAVPMIVGDKVIGVFDVQHDELDHFTDDDIRIQTTLAAQIAVAVQNAHTFGQAQKQAQREAMLNTINQKIQSATTVEAALQIAARELGRALGTSRTIAQLGTMVKSRNGGAGHS